MDSSDEEKSRQELISEIGRLRQQLAEHALEHVPVDATLAELKASEELNRRILEAVPGGIVHVSADGSVKAANAEALRILGLSFDTLTQRYTRDFDTETIYEDGAPCPADEYPVTQALATGLPQPPKVIGVRRPDGSVSWGVFTAVPVKNPFTEETEGAVVTFLDITERKNAEQALRDSEARLRSIVQSAPNIILQGDRNAIVTFINRTVFHAAPSLIVGRSLYDFVGPEDQDTVRAYLTRVLEGGETVTYEIGGPPGIESRWFRVSVGPVHHAEEIVGFTMIIFDVTEQKELRTRLTIADRMASIGTLAAGVAHEINNPLTYLVNNLTLLDRQLAGLDPAVRNIARRRIAEASEGADRIQQIVRDLGTFTRSADTSTVGVRLKDVLDSALRMAQHELKWRARVVREDVDVPMVRANASRLGQVFLNLLVNAAQAIVEGDVEANEVRVTTQALDEKTVCVEISDTGEGISREMQEKIFDPFVTTKSTGQGTGLGLYICHSIVTSMGGEISVRSVRGRGTTFSVHLPIMRREEAPTPARASDIPPPASANARVLVVDDEAAIRRMLAGALKDNNVVLAESGREALRHLEQGDFDVVICDLIMPDLTGMDVFAYVEEHRPEMLDRMVFITGGAFTERARDFLEEIPNHVVYKPFTAEQIRAIVTQRITAPPLPVTSP